MEEGFIESGQNSIVPKRMKLKKSGPKSVGPKRMKVWEKWSESSYMENNEALGELTQQGWVVHDEGFNGIQVKSSEEDGCFVINGLLTVRTLDVNWSNMCGEDSPKVV